MTPVLKDLVRPSDTNRLPGVMIIKIENVGGKLNYCKDPEIMLIPKYYSDHDAICITWQKL